MCKKNNLEAWIIWVCLVIALLATLAPFLDCDQDGILDSLATEEFLLVPVLSAFIGQTFVLIRFPSANLAALQFCSALIVPPPIPAY